MRTAPRVFGLRNLLRVFSPSDDANDKAEIRRLRADRGAVLFEALIAVGVLTTAALASLGTMLQTSGMAEDARERSRALAAATAQIDRIRSYESAKGLAGVVAHWADPKYSTFDAQGLEAPRDASKTTHCGSIEIASTDGVRATVTVVVRWWSRGANRQMVVPFTLAEMTGS